MKATKALDAFHDLIRKLRSDPDFSKVRFLRRFSTRPAENPVESYMVACSVSEIRSAPRFWGADSDKDPGHVSLTGMINIFYPFYTKADEAERFAALVAEGLFRADNASHIRSLEVKDPDFDSDLQTITRRILVKMDVCL